MNNRSLIDLHSPPPRWRCPRPLMAGPALVAPLAVGSAAQAQTAGQALRTTWTLQVAPIAFQSASFIAPTLRLGGSRALGSRWSVRGHWHGLQHRQDEYRGRVRSYQAAPQAQLTPQVEASLGVRYLKLRVDVDRPDWVGFARTVYRGPFVAVVATF